MASKADIIKFGPQNKSRIKGKVGHTRTGACTAKGKCNHGWIPQPKFRPAKKSSSKSKVGK